VKRNTGKSLFFCEFVVGEIGALIIIGQSSSVKVTGNCVIWHVPLKKRDIITLDTSDVWRAPPDLPTSAGPGADARSLPAAGDSGSPSLDSRTASANSQAIRADSTAPPLILSVPGQYPTEGSGSDRPPSADSENSQRGGVQK
jgi:hypothetical protein